MKSKKWKRRNRHKSKLTGVLLWLPITFDWWDKHMVKPEGQGCLQEDYNKWRQSIYDRMQ